jgi:hypothetical protein
MTDFALSVEEYGAAVDSPPAPEPDRENRESLTIRAPIELLQRARAAAEMETLARRQNDQPGVVTLNRVIVHALELHLAALEKANGTLPAPKTSARAESSKPMKDYAAAVAKKRASKD